MCVLVVNNDDPVLTHGCRDVPAGAFEHINVARDLGDLDLDLAEVLLLGRGEQRKSEQSGDGESAHKELPPSVCGL